MKARALVVSTFVAASLAAPGIALAEVSPEDRAVAEALFQEARKLMDEKRYAEACPKLEESQRVAPAGGTLLNLAACHEAVGRIAAAWAEYRDAEAQAKKSGRADREKIARARAAALAPMVPKLVVVVTPEVAALGPAVTRDGVAMGSAAWGVEIPVDPGPHELRVTAPGRTPWATKIELGASKVERVTVPMLEPEPVVEPPPPPPPPVAPVAEPRPPAAVTPPPSTRPPARPTSTPARAIVGWSLAGVGAASLGVGSYYGVRALMKRSDSNGACSGRLCSPEGYARNEEARSSARSSNLFLGLGVVVGGGGLAIALTAPGRSTEVSLGVTRSGFDLRGRF